jgi:hypothetical protein
MPRSVTLWCGAAFLLASFAPSRHWQWLALFLSSLLTIVSLMAAVSLRRFPDPELIAEILQPPDLPELRSAQLRDAWNREAWNIADYIRPRYLVIRRYKRLAWATSVIGAALTVLSLSWLAQS